MKPLEAALQYINSFFYGNVSELKNILADDLIFEGPFYKSCSADDYINSLKEDPPGKMNIKILKSYEDKNSACVLYQFSKENISTIMAQLFEIKNDKISKITLIFDSKQFEKH